MKDIDIPSDPDFKPCGDDYVETVGSSVILSLKRLGITKGARVSVNKELAKVQIGVQRPLGGFYEQTTDCQAAFEAGLDPEFVGRSAVAEFTDNLQRARGERN